MSDNVEVFFPVLFCPHNESCPANDMARAVRMYINILRNVDFISIVIKFRKSANCKNSTKPQLLYALLLSLVQHLIERLHLLFVQLNRKAPELKEKPQYNDIILGCKRGDRASQVKLYNALAPKMFAVCMRYMGDNSAAEDVLQDGFVTLFTKINTFSDSGSFEGWARKIFVNTALMSLRKNNALKNSEDLEEVKNLSSDEPTQVEDLGYKEIMKMVSSLPVGYRTVFNMYVVEGFSHNDIAEALGITSATSRSQLQRARMLLQEMIKNGKEV